MDNINNAKEGILSSDSSITLACNDYSNSNFVNAGEVITDGTTNLAFSNIVNEGVISGDETVIINSNPQDNSDVDFTFNNNGKVLSSNLVHINATKADNNSEGRIISHDKLIIEGVNNKASSVINKGELYAENEMFITSNDLSNFKDIKSSKFVNLVIPSQIDNAGNIECNDDLNINTATLNNLKDALMTSNSNINISNGILRDDNIEEKHGYDDTTSCKLVNDGTILSLGKLNIEGQDIVNNSNILGEEVVIDLHDSLKNNANICSERENLIIKAKNNVKNLGEKSVIEATCGQVIIETPSLSNSGIIKSVKADIILDLEQDIHNHGTIESGRDVLFNNETKYFYNEGIITSLRDITVKTCKLTKVGKILGGYGLTTVIVADNDVSSNYTEYTEIIMEEEENDEKDFELNEKFKSIFKPLRNDFIKSEEIKPSVRILRNMLVPANFVVLNPNDEICSRGILDIKIGIGLKVLEGANIKSFNDLLINSYTIHNEGSILSKDILAINTNDTLKNKANIQCINGLLNLNIGKKFYNFGKVTSVENCDIKAASIDNKGLIFSSGNLCFNVDTIIRNYNSIHSLKDIIFSGLNKKMDDLYNYSTSSLTAKIEAWGDIYINAYKLINKGEENGNYSVKTRYRNDTISSSKDGDWSNKRWISKYVYVQHKYETVNKLVEEEYVDSNLKVKPAYIKAKGDININIDNGVNQCSLIEAGKNLSGKIKVISNENLTHEIYRPYAFKYEETTTKYTRERERHLTIKILTFGLSNLYWTEKFSDNISVITNYKSKTFSLKVSPDPIIRSNVSISLEGHSISNTINGYVPKEDAIVISSLGALEEVKKTRIIKPEIDLPTNGYGLFKVNDLPSYTLPKYDTTSTKQVFNSSVNNPDSKFKNISTDSDFLNLHVSNNLTTDHESFVNKLPDNTLNSNTSLNTDIPAIPDISVSAINLVPSPINSKFLIQTSVSGIDQSKYYGSEYFLKHLTNVDYSKPLTFVGDPFYESKLVNEAIYKNTSRQYLYDNVASQEEQFKVLLDNSFKAVHDLNLSVGVALTKEQINNLKDDIVWYVDQEINGHQVLTPQVYLSKETLDKVSNPEGPTIKSRGTVNISLTDKFSNTGGVSGSTVQIKADSVINETLNNGTQASITSNQGAVAITSKNDIVNKSGKISGNEDTILESTEGSIINETKKTVDALGNESVISQAVIGGKGDTHVKAKQDFRNTGGKVTSDGNTVVKARDTIVDSIKLKKNYHSKSSSSSSDSGFFSSSSSSSSREHSRSEEISYDSSFDAAKNLVMNAERDMSFTGGDYTAGENIFIDAKGDINIQASEDVIEEHLHEESHSENSNLFRTKSQSKVYDKKTKEINKKGVNFNAAGHVGVKSSNNIKLEGVDIKANSLGIEADGTLDILKAYGTKETTTIDSESNNESWLGGLFKKGEGEDNGRYSRDDYGVGNNFAVNENADFRGKKGLNKQAVRIANQQGGKAKGASFISDEGDVKDIACLEGRHEVIHKQSCSNRQGLLGASFKNGFSLKIQEEIEKKTKSKKEGNAVGTSSVKAEYLKYVAPNGELDLNGTKIEAEKTLLHGRKGITLSSAEEVMKHQDESDITTKELSLEVKHKLVSLFNEYSAVKASTKALADAEKNYSSYKSQLELAKQKYKSGEIPEELYNKICSHEAAHLAAIAAATTNVAAATKNLTQKALDVGINSPMLGFSFEAQYNVNHLVETIDKVVVKQHKALINTKELTIITEGTLNLAGVDIASSKADIKAKEIVGIKKKDRTVGNFSNASNASNISLQANLKDLVSLGQSTNDGNGVFNDSQEHLNNIFANDLTLNIQSDVKGGLNIHANNSLGGYVGGSVLLDDAVSRSTHNSSGMGLSASVGFGSDKKLSSLGFGADYSRDYGDNANYQKAGITTGGKNTLQVNGPNIVASEYGSSVGDNLHDYSSKITKTKNIDYSLETNIGLRTDANISFNRRQTPTGKVTDTNFTSTSSFNYANKTRYSTRDKLGNEEVIFDNTVNTNITDQTVQTIVSPVETAKDIKDNAVGIGGMFKSTKDAIFGSINKGLSFKESLNLISGVVNDASILSTQSRDNELNEIINDGLNHRAEELGNAINKVSRTIQESDSSKPVSEVLLYQGSDPKVAGKALGGYAAGYDESTNKTFINIEKTDISLGRDIIQSIVHESQRKKTKDQLKGNGEGRDAAKETTIANLRGSIAGQRWSDYTDDEPKSKTKTKLGATSLKDWTSRNSSYLSKGNRIAAESNDAHVKPRIEKLLPNYWLAKLLGDEETAEKIKSACEFAEPFIPFVGPLCGLLDNVEEGNYVRAGIYLGLFALDCYTIGQSSTATNLLGVEEGILKLEQGVTKVSEEVIAKGQKHHLVSNKILKQIQDTPALSKIDRNTAELIVQAKDLASHYGYQACHRKYDKKVVDWLITKGNNITPKEFYEKIVKMHKTKKYLIGRFPGLDLSSLIKNSK